MSKSIGSTKQADRFRIEGLPDLSGLATEFLRRQPREAQVAVTIALETAAALRRSWADRTHVETLERMEHHLIHVALDIALATAAAQREALAEGVPEEVPERLQPFFVRRARADDLVGVSEAAAQLEVSRHYRLRLGREEEAPCLEVDEARLDDPGRADPWSR